MHSAQTLYDELTRALFQVNSQIKQIEANAQRVINERGLSATTDVYSMQYSNGTYLLTDLLTAKAQLLNGMAVIKAAEMKK